MASILIQLHGSILISQTQHSKIEINSLFFIKIILTYSFYLGRGGGVPQQQYSKNFI